jgi:pyrimidine operon attenuation protein/uracil phosphoribosyltransferase
MKPRVILSDKEFRLTIDRLCHQLIENHGDFSETCLIGVQPRGVPLADRIVAGLRKVLPKSKIAYGQLDVTFYRDDFRRGNKIITPDKMNIEFSIEGKNVVLVDDVFYTGRTIRAAMDALLDFGRPKKVELLTLVDRRFSRHVPIQPDYTGRVVDAVASEHVKVEWAEHDGRDKIILSEKEKE